MSHRRGCHRPGGLHHHSHMPPSNGQRAMRKVDRTQKSFGKFKSGEGSCRPASSDTECLGLASNKWLAPSCFSIQRGEPLVQVACTTCCKSQVIELHSILQASCRASCVQRFQVVTRKVVSSSERVRSLVQSCSDHGSSGVLGRRAF